MINNHYGSVNSEIIPNNKKIYRTAEKLWTLLAHDSWGPGFKVGGLYSRARGWGPDKYNNLVCTCLIKKQRYFSNIDFNFIQFIWNTNDANFGLNKLWNKKRSKLSCNSKGGNSSHKGIHPDHREQPKNMDIQPCTKKFDKVLFGALFSKV